MNWFISFISPSSRDYLSDAIVAELLFNASQNSTKNAVLATEIFVANSNSCPSLERIISDNNMKLDNAFKKHVPIPPETTLECLFEILTNSFDQTFGHVNQTGFGIHLYSFLAQMHDQHHPLLQDFIEYMAHQHNFSCVSKMERIMSPDVVTNASMRSSIKIGFNKYHDVKSVMARGAKVASGGCCSATGYEATNCFFPLKHLHFQMKQIISQQLAKLAEGDECPICFQNMTPETKFEFHRHLRTGTQARHCACNVCYHTLNDCPICRQPK